MYKQCRKHAKNKEKIRENLVLNFTEKIFFFVLPHWKNICDNMLKTLLRIDGKNNDIEKSTLIAWIRMIGNSMLRYGWIYFIEYFYI